jgi:poly(ribitol-phosphate) beta-N-acetylglucosaminyltransferase
VAVKVSVVVPVFNPGSHIDACIVSLQRQSLPAGEFEVIFVDDGSTDGTGERLDRLVAEHDNVHVIHIPNSGWPGRPRNVGLDATRGTYVLFMDNDDWLGDEALERLWSCAERTGADIVVGKVAGKGKSAPLELFRRNRDHATLAGDPLLTLLTPHKLFRRDFLMAHGLRFPEGRRRLEDHVFVLRGYFLARRISVLSDYPCYHWIGREDRSNASVGGFDAGYFENLREVLDIVEEHTEPGEFRDRLLRRWYRSKMLERLGGERFLAYSEAQREELYREVRALAAERFGPGVDRHLPSTLRIRGRLVAHGHYDALLPLALAETALRADVTVRSHGWARGVLYLQVGGTVVDDRGQPLRVRREQGRLRWQLPPGLPGARDVTLEDRDVGAELRASELRLFMRHRSTGEKIALPVDAETTVHERDGEATVHVHGTARLEPTVAAAGAPPQRGLWDLYAIVSICGISITQRLPAPRRDLAPPGVVGFPAVVVIPHRTQADNLSVDLGQKMRSLFAAAQLDGASVRPSLDDEEPGLAIGLPVRVHALDPVDGAQLRASPRARGGHVTAPARLVPAGAGARLECRLPFAPGPEAGRVSPGVWELSAVFSERSAGLGLRLKVGSDGRVSIRRMGRARRTATRAKASLRRRARRVPALRVAVRVARAVRRRAGG